VDSKKDEVGFCQKYDGVTLTNVIGLDVAKGIIKLVEGYQEGLKSPLEDRPAEVTKTSQFQPCPWAVLREHLPGIEDQVHLANFQFFGYNLFPPNGNQCLNLNTYKVGQEYKYHADGSHLHSNDIKLTCLFNISTEPYEGGDLQLKYGNEDRTVSLPPGALYIFKPNIFHRVTPITKGVRRTLTLWMYGPRWQ
tara:strand:- start:101 stop:679 length:579 start_codon:yes stop_codon:yes gene_type:complete